ncbi:MAG: RsmE family RNA methyltransferase, partial [Planctomycetaceae bacterium]
MSERFYIESPPADGRAVLPADESRHLVRVLRARVGDAVRLFDGRGSSWIGLVDHIDRERVIVAVSAQDQSPEPAQRLTIATALPKGDRQKWMVEKLTELGCARLVPLDTTRSVAEGTTAATTRLRRSVVEACKQCGRDRLMEIERSSSLADLIASGWTKSSATIVADPAGEAAGSVIASLQNFGDLLAVVGPEGGLADGQE